MKNESNTVLRPNAVPVYGFLSTIKAMEKTGKLGPGRRVLDCGAGGPVPPLAVFSVQGFDCWGVDYSMDQVNLAMDFCKTNCLKIRLAAGDMRSLPFPDCFFDFVYEQVSMCHLSHRDTATAVHEMYRIIKPGGLCRIGMISTDTQPHTLFGREVAPGEYRGEEAGEPDVLHSMFTDHEADRLVDGWEIILREKQITYFHKAALKMTKSEWMDLYRPAESNISQDDWKRNYRQRTNLVQCTHVYFILKKPE